MLECTAHDAVLQRGHVEVDQEADSQPGELQVREELRLVDELDLFHCLELEQHGVFDNHVGTEATTEREVFVQDRDPDLFFMRDALLLELVAKTLLVG